MAALPGSIALALLCALAGCDDAVDPWRDLVADHVTTTGHVRRIDCADPGGVQVAFLAGSRTYIAQSIEGLPDCATARIGDPVLVYYAPQDPATSTLLPPADAYRRARGWGSDADAWLALAGATAVAASILAKLRTTRRRAA